MTYDKREFQTVADLLKLLNALAKDRTVDLDTVYVMGPDNQEFQTYQLREQVLSDESVVVNLQFGEAE